jgi:diguanylate cyclase (GGDEF)-like protein
MRDDFQAERDAARRIADRQGIWSSFLMYMLFSATDVLLVPDVAVYTIAARFAVGLVMLPIFEWQFRKGAPADRLDAICATGFIVAYVAWLIPAITTEMHQNFSYYMIFGAIFMVGANLFFSFRFSLSLAASSIVLLVFFVALSVFPASTGYRLAFGTFYLSCFVFTSYINWNLNKERHNVFLNALEARIQQSEAAERGRALLRLSNTDPLTGLENRRSVDARLRSYWQDWLKAGASFSAILIDVDFFKKFNDYYGHQEGDRCLIIVANALTELVVSYDASIGRYGGEEFIVLAPTGDEARVLELASAICKTIEALAIKHEQRRDGMNVITVSVGAAYARNQTGAKLEKIIHEADRALYVAKANGRNCARVFDPADPQSSDDSENIAALLRIAVERDILSLVYQPIQNVVTGRTDGVEALMRLKMLDGTSVPPSLFIPVAERTGAILELGLWVIRTVCKEMLVDNHVQIVSVNVSPIQLQTPGFAASVAAILMETGVPGNRLAFEITEGLEMEMHSKLLRCISDLKLLGVKIWLDDFGTGFAGLSWLRLIDFDTVKIDRSFLHDCATPQGRSMLRDIVALVRNRGHRIIVEGVETDEQFALMREFKIEHVQGFHIARPASAADFRQSMVIENHPKPVLLSA